ncbi:MAG: acyl-CoA ligase [Solirubrobacterales bacterium]|nr:acyl-CoA ligase [Solirubrobacterales bacterium]
MAESANTASYADRIEPHRVHGSLYADPQVFDDEMKRIWRREWIALGHESEVAAPGDYVQKRLVGEAVVMVRDSDDRVRLFFNRCPHRGNQVCDAQRGNARVFRCPYHGWTFSSRGELLGYPYKSGYGGSLDKNKMTLEEVPRVESYQGFVFASLASEGPTLREHLGNAAEALDRLASFSPEGRIELNSGWLPHHTNANWKLIVENEVDGYHLRFVHNSILSVADNPLLALYNEKSESVIRALGRGHTEIDHRLAYQKRGERLHWLGANDRALPDYVKAMESTHGPDLAQRLLIDGPPHTMIWPNLFIAEIFVIIVEPLAVNASIQHQAPFTFVGAPDLNRMILRQFNGLAGPAGFLISDDADMYERNQRGLEAQAPEWLELSRGLHREETEPGGMRSSNITDETTQRAIWSRYRELLTSAS